VHGATNTCDCSHLHLLTTYLHIGMERLHKSMNTYTKSVSRRCDASEDKEKGLPISFLSRTMISHGEDFEADSEFGNCLITMGQGNERIAGIQETYIAQTTSYWLEGLERSLAMMKEYQVSFFHSNLHSRESCVSCIACQLETNKTHRLPGRSWRAAGSPTMPV
jgi:hypothetical protein